MSVEYHSRARVLDHLCEFRIVDLGAHDSDSRSRELLVRFSLLELGESLLEIRQDKVLRTCVGNEIQNVELVTRDHRIVSLSHFADLLHDLADFVVLLDGLSDGLVRDVYTQVLMHGSEKSRLELSLHVIVGEVLCLVRNIQYRKEEVLFVVAFQDTEVLVESVHHRACIDCSKSVQELESSLDGSLEQSTRILADVVRHIICRDVDRSRPRSAQSD